MSKAALLGFYSDGNRATIYHEQDEQRYVETRQDVTHIIEAAKIIADEKPGKDFRHSAFIPESIINKAMIEGWFHDKAAWKKWANDPVNACYRTWKGRL